MYDVIIVGGGPAGLFAAYELATKSNKTVLLIEKGKGIETRQKSEVMCGIGGAGTFSDGKLHFTPCLSHEKMLDLYSVAEYQEYVDYVDKLFSEFGVNAEYYPKDTKKVQELVDRCKKNSIHLFVRKIRHVGSDKLPRVIGNFENYLKEKEVEIMTEKVVSDIVVENDVCNGVMIGDKLIEGRKVILAPGRFNASWMQEIAKKHGLNYEFEKVEVGVRVEFPEGIMREYSDQMYEAIFMIRTPSYDDVMRSFCPCPRGLVAIEDYDGFVCVNGHSNSDHKSENSNFAFVTEIKLTEPVENTTSYAKSIAQLANTIGGGKPILQRLADLRSGRRSTWDRIKKSYVQPSLKDVVPGDISMAFPHRVVTNLIEGLRLLDKVMPGIYSGNTLLYAPEIKLRSSKIKTDKFLESKIKNLYVAGDGAGVSGNIVGAAATGIIAAKGILR
ncbi:FAD-dependent oxidoreductase [archaeon]|nr:FAD-dependent oxidoreductase [archaeon]